MILIVTNKVDSHSDIVIRKLHELHIPFYRFNTEDFPQKVCLTLQQNIDGQRIVLDTPHGAFNLNRVKSIWYRRPKEGVIASEIEDIYIRAFTKKETKTMLTWLWGCLEDRFWVNHPQSNRVAGNKLLQEHVARGYGVRTPDYLITNDYRKARRFVDQYPTVVVKPISGGMVKRKNDYHLIYTNRLSDKDLLKLGLVTYAPTFFQEYIPKSFELRITVVGNSVFACRINSQDSEKTKDDWRRYDFDNVDHLPYDLPNRIEDFCHKLVNHFGLHFGAIDMIVTPKGEYVFLEINPNGQWAWIEDLTGMPITDALVDILEKGARI